MSPARRHIAALTLTAIATASTLAACGGGSGTSASHVTLVLYNAQHEQTTSALVSAFEAKTGIKVEVKNNDEDVLTAQIENEGTHSPADLFYTENSNWLQQLDDRGLLAAVDSATLGNVPSVDNATNGDWLGVSARISLLTYDPAKISASQLPKSILALANPEYKGKIEIAPSETDFWPIVCSVQQAYGTARTLAWLRGLKANAGSNDNVPDNETLTSDVASGTTDLAVINHYYYYRLIAEIGQSKVPSKLAYFSNGDPGYIENISGIAILKSSKHQTQAQQFLNFVTSSTGQSIIAHSESFEYPIRPGVAANSELTPLDQLHPHSWSPAKLGTGLEAKTLLTQAGLLS